MALTIEQLVEYTVSDVGNRPATDRAIRNWLTEPEFAAEVDRLSLMVNIASKAERLRLAMRAVRQKTKGEVIDTQKDLLDWLKFAQSETDGVKLDLTKLAATFREDEAPVANSRCSGTEYPN